MAEFSVLPSSPNASASSIDGDGAQDSSTIEFTMLAKSMNFNLPVKLDWDNYIHWKVQVLPAIEAFELEKFISDSSIIPPRFIEVQSNENAEKVVIANKEFTKWKKADKLLMCWLLSTISQSIIGEVTSCTSSRQIWKTLADLYSHQSMA